MTISYTRPTKDFCHAKEKGQEASLKSGAGVIEPLHEFLIRGLRLKGQNCNLGFLFFYELLIGSFPLRLLSGDQPAILAHFLIRTLPKRFLFFIFFFIFIFFLSPIVPVLFFSHSFSFSSETCSPSVLMSVLRVLTNNPALLHTPGIPQVSLHLLFCSTFFFAALFLFSNVKSFIFFFLSKVGRHSKVQNFCDFCETIFF